MNNTINIPPRRRMESHTAYVAVNVMDSNDRLTIVADTETHAKIELIDQLGYHVVPNGGVFYLCDVEDDTKPAIKLAGTTLEAALDEVLKAAKWKIHEPMDMVGGSLGQGFEEVDDE